MVLDTRSSDRDRLKSLQSLKQGLKSRPEFRGNLSKVYGPVTDAVTTFDVKRTLSEGAKLFKGFAPRGASIGLAFGLNAAFLGPFIAKVLKSLSDTYATLTSQEPFEKKEHEKIW